VLLLVPLDRELVGGTDDQATFVERDGLGRVEKAPDGMIWKFATRLIDDALPCFLGGQLRRCS
jgi:hypothetical protein